jgi:hypothetical protein
MDFRFGDIFESLEKMINEQLPEEDIINFIIQESSGCVDLIDELMDFYKNHKN